ncbi:hypothetical protein Ctob_015351 [Chrysochromulina tobinii]|uniref:Uncharacterized protein n=1 Tax=Chrysochromulina tobinii TaxID=1460289 RepID=A0A0M0JWT4_9EUKA|nr:hypothetical protein Ctob_015351 [Chrysochromulina tobinii]|eukprot:KOO30995.1 hypothetical protein Ctob_015351 [Chrysochromulina sp. CCMP291]
MQVFTLFLAFIALASAFQAPVSRVASSRTSAVTMKEEKEEWSLANFLSSGRKSFYGEKSKFGEKELLSGAARPTALETLSKRFAFDYDTRPKGKSVKPVKKSNSKFNPKDAKTW